MTSDAVAPSAEPSREVEDDLELVGARPRWRIPRERVASLIGDALALTLLAGVLLYWEANDGGRYRDAIVPVAIVALLAVPIAMAEARRLPASARRLIAAYGAGWIAAVAFAVDRHDWVTPTLILAIVPLVGLAARRVWRRPWGPSALLLLLLLSFGMYTERSWLQWWGFTLSDRFQPRWMPLSWHNQSGALMGAFGLLFLGLAWCSRRIIRMGMVLLSAGALAGVWLSSSRGAVAFSAAALLLTVLLFVRTNRDRLRTTVITTTVVIVTTGGLVLALQTMLQAGDETPLASRGDTADKNAKARLNHMEAAFRMFLDRPLTGQGTGSYEIVALDFTDADANLTASAHNEYLEVLGEGGLAGGVPFVLLHVGAGVMVWRRTRRWSPPAIEGTAMVDVRSGLRAGLLGAGVLVAAHSAFDFNWGYAVLPAILAIGAAVWSTTGPDDVPTAPATAWRSGVVAVVPLALLLAGTLGGHAVERIKTPDARGLSAEQYAAMGAPWDASLRGDIARRLFDDGHVQLAAQVLSSARSWNPGVDPLRSLEAIVRHEMGELTGPELVDTLEPGRSRFASYLNVAQQLYEHDDHELALQVLDEVETQMQAHSSWGVIGPTVQAGRQRMMVAAATEGCEAAATLGDELASRFIEDVPSIDALVDETLDEVCPTSSA